MKVKLSLPDYPEIYTFIELEDLESAEHRRRIYGDFMEALYFEVFIPIKEAEGGVDILDNKVKGEEVNERR